MISERAVLFSLDVYPEFKILVEKLPYNSFNLNLSEWICSKDTVKGFIKS